LEAGGERSQRGRICRDQRRDRHPAHRNHLQSCIEDRGAGQLISGGASERFEPASGGAANGFEHTNPENSGDNHLTAPRRIDFGVDEALLGENGSLGLQGHDAGSYIGEDGGVGFEGHNPSPSSGHGEVRGDRDNSGDFNVRAGNTGCDVNSRRDRDHGGDGYRRRDEHFNQSESRRI
jgi:hypothetical protein